MVLADGIVGRHEAVFIYHPFVFAVTILVSFLTVLISGLAASQEIKQDDPLEA